MIVQLRRLIHDKIVCVMAHGKSIEELEQRIEEFKDYNTCWVSMGQFDLMEQHILSKIGKKLSIIQDCSEVENARKYESECRFPRVREFLLRPEANQFITADVIIDSMYGIGQKGFLETPEIENKIYVITKETWSQVPNGMTLLLTTLALNGARKIIVFGLDGYEGDSKEARFSYYRYKERESELITAFGSLEKSGLHSDSHAFNYQFHSFYTFKRIELNLDYIPIINCSINSIFTLFPKISYEEIHKEFV